MDDGVLVLRKKGKNNHSSFPFQPSVIEIKSNYFAEYPSF